MVNSTILCLAAAIFHESRGEPIKAQYAVAEVIDNRVKSKKFPNDHCSVIKQKSQFSFYKGSQSLKKPKHELDAWNKSLSVAKDFYSNKTNYTKGSLYFNHKRLGVRFGGKLKYKNGNHVFF